MTEAMRKPQAFRLDRPETPPSTKPARHKPAPKISIQPMVEPEPALPVPAPLAAAAPRRRQPWGFMLITSLLSLFALGVTLYVSDLVERLFAWSLTLGWISVALATLAGFAALMILLRELWAFARLRKIEKLQIQSARAINLNDKEAAEAASAGLRQLYAGRPDLTWALQEWGSHQNDIIDPPAAMRLAERVLLEPLDDEARRVILRRAKRVTLLSTITPTAALDVLLVGFQNLFMIREIAEVYGGRPTFLTTLRLARMVVAHLAVTAGLAMGENVLHLVVGKGLLGRLSARLGEGAINGILSTRLGLAACDICRPIALAAPKREKLAAMLREVLISTGGIKVDD